ncbi:MAG: AMP-binding enzyme [Promethearchaeota archaeon]
MLDITVEELKKWCEENMARWKCPKYIEFIKEIPVTPTGKVQRRLLQERDLAKMKEGKSIENK